MEKKRQIYEKKSEVMLKRLLSKFYSLEADYLVKKMNAQKKLNKISDNIPSGEEQIKKLRDKQKKLTNLYQGMMASSQEAWKETISSVEQSAEKMNEEKQNISERTQEWLNNLGEWITDLEKRTEHTSGQVREQLRTQVDQLKDHQANLQGKLKELRETTGENWEKITTSIDDEVNTMTASIDKVYQHLFASENREKDTEKS
ncbi:MAG: hypothetical protein R6U04_00715 [Bacteroidales bacterium]